MIDFCSIDLKKLKLKSKEHEQIEADLLKLPPALVKKIKFDH